MSLIIIMRQPTSCHQGVLQCRGQQWVEIIWTFKVYKDGLAAATCSVIKGKIQNVTIFTYMQCYHAHYMHGNM